MTDSVHFLSAAIFLNPLEMTNNGFIFLWAFPLVACIAAVYKATKLDCVTSLRFVRESLILTVTILGFMFLIAVALWLVISVLT